jgi:hypothetical protein
MHTCSCVNLETAARKSLHNAFLIPSAPRMLLASICVMDEQMNRCAVGFTTALTADRPSGLQACQIRCGDLFENEAVGKFNACAVSQKKCVPKKEDDGYVQLEYMIRTKLRSCQSKYK